MKLSCQVIKSRQRTVAYIMKILRLINTSTHTRTMLFDCRLQAVEAMLYTFSCWHWNTLWVQDKL